MSNISPNTVREIVEEAKQRRQQEIQNAEKIIITNHMAEFLNENNPCNFLEKTKSGHYLKVGRRWSHRRNQENHRIVPNLPPPPN